MSELKKKRTRSQRGKLIAELETCSTNGISFTNVTKFHPALREYTGYCFHKLTSILKSHVNKSLADLDIQVHHLAILSIIASSSDVNQMQLSEETGIDKASMVKVVDHLEKAKLIERVGSKIDRRVKKLLMTQKGIEILKKANAARHQVELSFLSPLNSSQSEVFRSLILKLLDHHKSL